ncbi:MAG: hypothetical protein JXR25_14655 [Pontiellaceae bacterium]|nr:hypothetical protein [Pontiellaceae bacterium]MBN2786061.1 hypothetical protein [Pontiellaceae bacterium]
MMVTLFAQARSVNFNFDSYGGIGNSDGSFNNSMTGGVYATAGWINDWWVYPKTDLMDNAGVSTSLDIDYSGAYANQTGNVHPGMDADGTYNKEMLNGFQMGMVTLDQIPYDLYDIYVYFASTNYADIGTISNGDITFSFGVLDNMIDGANSAFMQTTDEGLGYPDANYAVFSDLSGESQYISISFDSGFGGICAIQVVESARLSFSFDGAPVNAAASGTASLTATVTEESGTFKAATLYLDGVPVAVNNTRTGSVNVVSYEVEGLLSGVHTGRVDAVSTASDPLVVQSYSWTFERLSFGDVICSPGFATASRNPTLLVDVVEGASMVDEGATTLSIDGISVDSLVFDRSSAPTTTISCVVGELAFGMHTGEVFIAGNPNGGQTNTWTFAVVPEPPVDTAQVVSWNFDSYGTVNSPDGMTYSPVSAGIYPAANWNNSWRSSRHTNLMDNAGVDTTLDIDWVFDNDAAVIGSIHPGPDTDGSFNREMLQGYLNAGASGSVKQSTVVLSQIPYAEYTLYVYFSSDVAGRQGTVTDGATTYYFNTYGPDSINTDDGNAVFVEATDTTDAGYAVAANYAVFSGLTARDRTIICDIPVWGGIAGIQVVNAGPVGPVVEPVITGIDVSGSGVTLSWSADNTGTYSIERKTNLASGIRS